MGLESSSFARIWGMADAKKVHESFHLGCVLLLSKKAILAMKMKESCSLISQSSEGVKDWAIDSKFSTRILYRRRDWKSGPAMFTLLGGLSLIKYLIFRSEAGAICVYEPE
jgi:hypothetical protein